MKTGSDSKVTIATNYFSDGYSCSQSVLAAFALDFGLDVDTALKLADGFGGGMTAGETCGVVTGAVMVLGLRYGRTHADNKETKQKMNACIREFYAKFKERHADLLCRALLGYDISDPEEKAIIDEKGLTKKQCPVYITTAVELLQELV